MLSFAMNISSLTDLYAFSLPEVLIQLFPFRSSSFLLFFFFFFKSHDFKWVCKAFNSNGPNALTPHLLLFWNSLLSYFRNTFNTYIKCDKKKNLKKKGKRVWWFISSSSQKCYKAVSKNIVKCIKMMLILFTLQFFFVRVLSIYWVKQPKVSPNI